ncbi:2Fe-2S iron-sulfur cluster-binding protein [Andreprevotia chitinilytica]|uniref:2Fe-2S iron-sulfur cluster-binding protein n=1 Tax=Andreprevotia chitinilytica TaxID=396808 RepID=UPI00054FBAA0|nr:2Fe-2S iron-sulfur cluster-binding protein [Andreprevotia chitinilytica]
MEPTPDPVTIRFVDAAGVLVTQALAERGSRLIDLVRALTRDGELALSWRCAQGTCGACVVYLGSDGDGSGDEGGQVELPAIERNVLVRRELLPVDAPRWQIDSPTLPRLACHVRCTADLFVYI